MAKRKSKDKSTARPSAPKPRRHKEKPATIDEYLAGVSADKRAALEKLRAVIRSIVPGAEECISYGLPTFRRGRMLVAFGAASRHCSFFPLSSAALIAHADDLASYDTGPGTIRFQPDRPLPVALVRKLIKTRMAENAARDARLKKK
jgi:uncharacterized protein YdhG (YjbR/CyaY superfamily)